MSLNADMLGSRGRTAKDLDSEVERRSWLNGLVAKLHPELRLFCSKVGDLIHLDHPHIESYLDSLESIDKANNEFLDVRREASCYFNREDWAKYLETFRGKYVVGALATLHRQSIPKSQDELFVKLLSRAMDRDPGAESNARFGTLARRLNRINNTRRVA